MRHIFVYIFVFAITTNFAHDTENKSLFERLGGTEGITQIVDEVVETHMKNPAINARFLPYKDYPERLAAIKKHIVDFFSAGSGGNTKYNGRDMPAAHRGMNISHAEYMHVIDDILLVLENRKIDKDTQKDVLNILWSLKGKIIEK